MSQSPSAENDVYAILPLDAWAEELQEMAEMVIEELGSSAEILYGKQIAATLALNTGPGLIGVAALLDS